MRFPLKSISSGCSNCSTNICRTSLSSRGGTSKFFICPNYNTKPPLLPVGVLSAVRKPDSVARPNRLRGRTGGRSFIWALDRSRARAALPGFRQGTALHSVRVLPFHLRFPVPMAELSRQRRDGAPPAFSNRGVTARTSMLSHGGC